MKMREFHALAWQKFIENLLSVKVWIIFCYLFTTLYLAVNNQMTGATFAETNAAVIGIVLGIREAIKIQRIKMNGKNGNGEEAQTKSAAKFQV